MSLQHLFSAWLRNMATARLREAVATAAREQFKKPPDKPQIGEVKPCDVGFVFALGIESGCFEDLLQGMVTVRGSGFTVREGGLDGRRVAVMLSGAGQAKAAQATELLLEGHRPTRIVSAGFAGALTSELARNDIFIANRLVNVRGEELPIDVPAGLVATSASVRIGRLLTVDRIVRHPREKRDLAAKYCAQAVDMETFAVAEVCRKRGVPFFAVRVISDTSNETLPPDIEHILAQKSAAGRVGAAVGSIWRRPGSTKDFYQLYENALLASKRLAKFLVACGLE